MEKETRFEPTTSMDQALDQLNSLDQLDVEVMENYAVPEKAAKVATDEIVDVAENEVTRMSDEEFDTSMSQLNKFVGSIYEELEAIDTSFKKVSDYFFKEADKWADAAEKKDIGLSSDEGKTALAIASIGILVKGFGKIIGALSTQKKLSGYKDICSEIVKSKGPYIDSMVDLANRALESAMDELNGCLDLDMDASYAYNSDERFYAQKKILMMSLNRYRQSQFVFNQMIWLRAQMIAWQNGELEDTASPHPSYNNINFNIFFTLHPYKERADKGAQISEIRKTCDFVVEEYTKMMNEEYNRVSSAFVISLCDSELMATLLDNCSENARFELYNLYSDFSVAPQKSAYRKELLDSAPLSKAFKLTEEEMQLKSRQKSHDNLICCNGLLLCIIACFPVIAYSGWGWWNILPCIVIVGVIGYRTVKSSCEVEDKYNAKLELLSRWRANCILKMTGDTPILKSVTIVNNKIWGTLWGAVLGAIIGSFFLPPIGTIIGVCLGAIIGDTDEDGVESDGHDYKSVNTGSYTKTKVWTWVLSIVIALEVIGYFV